MLDIETSRRLLRSTLHSKRLIQLNAHFCVHQIQRAAHIAQHAHTGNHHSQSNQQRLRAPIHHGQQF